MKKTIAAVTIGGGVIVAASALIQLSNYKNNSNTATALAVVTLLVGIAAINYSSDKIKYS